MKNTLYDHVTLAYHACALLYEYLENTTSNPFTESGAQEHMLYVRTHNYLNELKSVQENESKQATAKKGGRK